MTMQTSAETLDITASLEQLVEDAELNAGRFLNTALAQCRQQEIEPAPELLGSLVLAMQAGYGESCITAKLNRLAKAVEDVGATLSSGVLVQAMISQDD